MITTKPRSAQRRIRAHVHRANGCEQLESRFMLSAVSVVAPDSPPPSQYLRGTTSPSVVEPSASAAAQPGQGSAGGTGFFGDSGQRLRNAETRSVALADLDGDRDIDAFVANRDANEVWLNDGRGTFQNSGQQLGNSNSNAVALGDLDGDGDLDAFLANSGPDKVWLNDGEGVFQQGLQNFGRSTSNAVALGDLNGDGRVDIFVGKTGGNEVWLNLGPAGFSGRVSNWWTELRRWKQRCIG